MNKTIVIAGAVVFLVIVGGIFLSLSGTSLPDESGTAPTQWSQAGDYRIEETPQGTIVTNEKARFDIRH